MQANCLDFKARAQKELLDLPHCEVKWVGCID